MEGDYGTNNISFISNLPPPLFKKEGEKYGNKGRLWSGYVGKS